MKADLCARILARHERLGDRFLALCKQADIEHPTVGWYTPPDGSFTQACIFWKDTGGEEIVDGPLELLADIVFARVLSGQISRSALN